MVKKSKLFNLDGLTCTRCEILRRVGILRVPDSSCASCYIKHGVGTPGWGQVTISNWVGWNCIQTGFLKSFWIWRGKLLFLTGLFIILFYFNWSFILWEITIFLVRFRISFKSQSGCNFNQPNWRWSPDLILGSPHHFWYSRMHRKNQGPLIFLLSSKFHIWYKMNHPNWKTLTFSRQAFQNHLGSTAKLGKYWHSSTTFGIYSTIWIWDYHIIHFW